MFLSLKADIDAVLVDDKLMLFFENILQVLLIKVDPSKPINNLVNGLYELNPFFKMFSLIYLFRQESYYKIRMCAGECDHQIECIFEVKVIEYEYGMDDLFGLFVVLCCDLFECLVYREN